jgi:hypothetical protein
MFQTVKEKIIRTTKIVMGEAIKTGQNPRKAAMDLAKKRVATKSVK